MTQNTGGTQQRAGAGLLVAVGLGAFALGGFVIGAVFLWKLSERPRPIARKTPLSQTRTSPRSPAIDRRSAPAIDRRSAPAVKQSQTSQPDPRRSRPASRSKAAPRPSTKRPTKSRKPKESSATGSQMWGAPDWIFHPQGGLIGKLRLIKLQEVQKTVGFAHLKAAILQGIPRSGVYDAVQFQPTKPIPKAPKANFGLGVQLWLHPQAGPIVRRWRRYQRGYPNARMLPVAQRVGRDSFVAKRAPIAYLLFRTSRRHGLVILSCHEALCERKALVSLAKRIDQRIQ